MVNWEDPTSGHVQSENGAGPNPRDALQLKETLAAMEFWVRQEHHGLILWLPLTVCNLTIFYIQHPESDL